MKEPVEKSGLAMRSEPLEKEALRMCCCSACMVGMPSWKYQPFVCEEEEIRWERKGARKGRVGGEVRRARCR